jgi:SAM-dependent methyltransferase
MVPLGERTVEPVAPGAEAASPGELLSAWFGETTRPDAALHPRLMRFADGRIMTLPVHRWAGPVTEADESLLARAVGPVLDVGCGPGRLTAALHERGVEVVGLDVVEQLPMLVREVGAPLLLASVWDQLPREGQWRSVLLADGNIGIGGDPTRLLRRVCSLLRPDGTVLLELQPAGEAAATGDQALIRLEELGRSSTWFRWGMLSGSALPAAAAASGLAVQERWSAEGRDFAALTLT